MSLQAINSILLGLSECCWKHMFRLILLIRISISCIIAFLFLLPILQYLLSWAKNYRNISPAEGSWWLQQKAHFVPRKEMCSFLLGGAEEKSPFCPEFIKSATEFTGYVTTPFAMRLPSVRFRATEGLSLGEIYDLYFNRDIKHFCSHQFTPHRTEAYGYDTEALTDSVLYFAHPVFATYCLTGMNTIREFATRAMNRLAGADRQLKTSNLTSAGRVSLLYQESKERYILHLLNGNTALRGYHGKLPNGQFPAKPVEVIEELSPVQNVSCLLNVPGKVRRLPLVSEMREIDFQYENERICFSIDEFTCHTMIVIEK